MRIINDPELYRELLEPFESADTANSTLERFYADLRQLRQNAGIPDVYVIVNMNYIESGGKEVVASSALHCGDGHKAVAMTGYAAAMELEKLKRLNQLLAQRQVDREVGVGKETGPVEE